MGNSNSNFEKFSDITIQEIKPLNYNENYFYQFESKQSKQLNQLKQGLSSHQMKVHFNEHYVKVYVKNTNEFIKNNPELYIKIMTNLNIKDINSLTPTYVLSDNSKFLQSLYFDCNNENAQHNIGQLFYHMLFFSGLTSKNISRETFMTHSAHIFKTTENLELFNKNYTDITKKHFASGWACFTYDKNKDMLKIIDTQDHIIPKLEYNNFMVYVVDLWEHAFYIDYEADKLQYHKDVLKYINWKIIYETIEYYRKN